jgi:hypothetical protein
LLSGKKSILYQTDNSQRFMNCHDRDVISCRKKSNSFSTK